LLIVAGFASAASSKPEQNPEGSPFASWKPGSRVWKLAVTRYRPDDETTTDAKLETYHLWASVIGKEIVNGNPCWKLCMRPDKSAPVFLSYFVSVDQESGWVRKLSHSPFGRSIP